MLDLSFANIIESLVKKEPEAARKNFELLHPALEGYELIHFLIELDIDRNVAFKIWDSIDKSTLEPLFTDVINAYLLYLKDERKLLEVLVESKDPEEIFNVIEANNLAFYAHELNLEQQELLLRKAQTLNISSQLLQSEKQTGEFRLFHPVTLLNIHFQVIRFLNQHFEKEEDLNEMIRRINKEKPL